MSGHSKWAQIKRQKGTADQKRGVLFTKLGNAITLAARERGGNPESNFSLRLAIEKARAANMPKENIERAIKRGIGELEGEKIEEIVYEGFGPSQIAVIIEVLTNNKNRSASTIKHIFTKYGGNLGSPNSVKWMFEKKGVIKIKSQNSNKEEIELKIIDWGAEDFKEEGEELIIYIRPEELQKIKENLEKNNLVVDNIQIEWLAKEEININQTKEKEKIVNFFTELEDNEEVNNFYSNVNLNF